MNSLGINTEVDSRDIGKLEKETSAIFKAGKSVMFIGNGPSILEKSLGSQIDDFDIVVRFNQFVIKGYEKSVGYKTDVWCCNEGIGRGKPNRALATGAWAQLLACNPDKIWKQLRALEECKDVFLSRDLISKQVWKNVTDAMNGIEPSSGMLAIRHALQFVDKVYTLGFDCMSPGKKHYFERGDGSKHRPEVERAYYNILLNSGRVIEFI